MLSVSIDCKRIHSSFLPLMNISSETRDGAVHGSKHVPVWLRCPKDSLPPLCHLHPRIMRLHMRAKNLGSIDTLILLLISFLLLSVTTVIVLCCADNEGGSFYAHYADVVACGVSVRSYHSSLCFH
jgi:hypothetical protein